MDQNIKDAVYLQNIQVLKPSTKSRNKKGILRIKFQGLENKYWYPRMTDLAEICSELYKLEDRRYPDGRGGELFREFINRAFDGQSIDKLEKEFFKNNQQC